MIWYALMSLEDHLWPDICGFSGQYVEILYSTVSLIGGIHILSRLNAGINPVIESSRHDHCQDS